MTPDDAYANAAHIPDGESYPDRWLAEARAFAEQARAAGRAEMAQIYGEAERERFDLFHPEGSPRGLLVFVHGGFWKALGREWWSHFAQGALARGWAVAMPSYTLCPDIRISGITRQIARAVRAAAERVDGPVALAGHSAGGHLVARMLAPGMLPPALFGRLSHVAPISPLSDLRPLMDTAMNATLKIDAAEARAESPIYQPTPRVPVTVWIGADERPGFLDQAAWLAGAWSRECKVVPGRHHFDVIDALRDPGSAMVVRLTGTG